MIVVVTNYCPSAPSAPSNAATPSNSSYLRKLGSMLVYTCNPGYIGAPNSTCLKYNYTAGQWATIDSGCTGERERERACAILLKINIHKTSIITIA